MSLEWGVVPGTVVELSVPSHPHSTLLLFRGHKRKLSEDNAASDSSRGSSDADGEGSSSEADEMAAALEAELNDLM